MGRVSLLLYLNLSPGEMIVFNINMKSISIEKFSASLPEHFRWSCSKDFLFVGEGVGRGRNDKPR